MVQGGSAITYSDIADLTDLRLKGQLYEVKDPSQCLHLKAS